MPSTNSSSCSTGSPRAKRGGRVFLLGHGIAYSASPAMQTAAFRAAGLDWSYDVLDVAPDQLPGAVTTMCDQDVIGANVSIPYKVAVMPLLDGLEGEAVEAGAVNTIRSQDDQL